MVELGYHVGQSLHISRRDGHQFEATLEYLEPLPQHILGEYDKAFVVLHGGGRSFPMLLKRNYHAAETLAMHEDLHDAEIPVIAKMRMVDHDTIAMTDLRSQGKVPFGKAMLGMMQDVEEIGQETERKRKSKAYLASIPGQFFIDFMDLTQDMSSLELLLTLYGERANARRIMLSDEEGFEYVVDTSHRGEFLLLDIDSTRLAGATSDEDMKINNLLHIADTMRTINGIRRWINKQAFSSM